MNSQNAAKGIFNEKCFNENCKQSFRQIKKMYLFMKKYTGSMEWL